MFRVFDVETTGLDPANDRICSIALVDCDASGITAKYYSLVNPGMKIPPSASGIHHITDKDVQDAPLIGQIWKEILPTDRLLVAHNAVFDMGFLGVDRPALCTYRLAQHLYPEAPDHKNMTLRYYLDLDCSEVAGEPAHRADVDAFVTAQILLRMLKDERLTGMGPDESVRYADRAIKQDKIRFGKHAGTPWSKAPYDYLLWMKRNEGNWDKDTRYNLKRHLGARASA